MKANRALQIQANIAFGPLLVPSTYDLQKQIRGEGRSPRWFRFYLLKHHVAPEARAALHEEFTAQQLTDDQVDTLLRYTFKDVFGFNQWSAQK